MYIKQGTVPKVSIHQSKTLPVYTLTHEYNGTLEQYNNCWTGPMDSFQDEYGHTRVGAVNVMYSKLQNEVAFRSVKWPKENSYKIAWKTLQYGMF